MFSWPSVFGISVFLGFFCLFLVHRYVPETLPPGDGAGIRFREHAADQFGQPDVRIGWWFAVFVGLYLPGANLARRGTGDRQDTRLLDLGAALRQA